MYADIDTDSLERLHFLLKQELANITHWQRLVRAKIDLCTAHASAPKPLGGALTEYLDSTTLGLWSPLDDLPHVTLSHLESLAVSDLLVLKGQYAALGNYERRVRSQYIEASDELARRHAKSPNV